MAQCTIPGGTGASLVTAMLQSHPHYFHQHPQFSPKSPPVPNVGLSTFSHIFPSVYSSSQLANPGWNFAFKKPSLTGTHPAASPEASVPAPGARRGKAGVCLLHPLDTHLGLEMGRLPCYRLNRRVQCCKYPGRLCWGCRGIATPALQPQPPPPYRLPISSSLDWDCG